MRKVFIIFTCLFLSVLVKAIDPIPLIVKPLKTPQFSISLNDTTMYMYMGNNEWIKLVTDYRLRKDYVPYTGAIKDVNLNTHSIAASGIKLNTTNPLTVINTGEIAWNSHDRTINIKTPNTSIQVSQEQTFPVKNISGATLLDGRLVRITGYDAVNDYYTVSYSDNGSEATAFVDFMLSESIADGAVGLATKVGLVHGLNTTGGISQNPVYLSTSGQFMATEPAYPAWPVVVGTFGHIDAVNGDIFVDLNKSSQYEINKINNELELKGMQNPGICQKCPITANDIVINTTALTLTIATVKDGQTISPSNPVRFFTDGGGVIHKWEKTAPITFSFTNTTGIWYFYFDNSGSPIATQVPWSDFGSIASVYRLYWNATLAGAARNVVEAAEYHINDISASDHRWKHNEGAKHLSGLDYTANVLTTGSPNADGRNTVLSLSSGDVVDDNLVYTVTNAPAGITKFTQDLGNTIAGSLNNTNSGLFSVRISDASGLLNKLPATRFPFSWDAATNRPEYITQTGVRTLVSNQSFFVYFVYALQDPRRGEAVKVVSALTEYATELLAEASNWEQLQAVYPTLRDNEIRLLYKLTFEYKSNFDVGAKYSVLRKVDDLRKLRITSTAVASGTVLASNVIVTPAGNITSLDAQSALQQLDANIQQHITNDADLSTTNEIQAPTRVGDLIGLTQTTTTISIADKAPASGSGNYIQNQNASAQAANMWISGGIASSAGFPFISNLNGSKNWAFHNDLTNFYLVPSATVNSSDWDWSKQTKFSSDGTATFASTIQATTAKLTNLSDGYIPYHISDASGLGNSPIYTDGTNVGIGTTAFKTVSSIEGGDIINGLSDLNTKSTALFKTANPSVYLSIGYENTDNVAIQSADVTGAVRHLFINKFGGNTILNSTSGNVGIGYSTGTEITNNKLAVNGSGYFNGDIRINGIQYGRNLLKFTENGVETGGIYEISADVLYGGMLLNHNALLDGSQFRNTIPSWQLDLGGYNGGDLFAIRRKAAGGSSWTNIVSTDNVGNFIFSGTINSTGYLLNGNNLFSLLSNNTLMKWDGTKAISISNGVGLLSNDGSGNFSYWNPSVQSLSGTTTTWTTTSGVNAKITITADTTIYMTGLVSGQTGNITIINPSTAYKLKFTGYTLKISPALTADSGGILLSGSSKTDVLSWYYDGDYVIINGTLSYQSFSY